MKISRNCPETCIVFVTCGRAKVAAESYESLLAAIRPYRKQVRLVISDATDDDAKIRWAREVDADDVILTPKFTPAAVSRNLATALISDKYTPQYLCMLEDDFQYRRGWYNGLRDAAERLYGVVSPWGLAYGVFCACDVDIPPQRMKLDNANKVKAYLFGAVAYQRFMPYSHYVSTMRFWDPDLLGISYAQTGGQTFRNTMRGFCGAIIPGKLSMPIEDPNTVSTWRKGKRDPGPPAHSFEIERYNVICEAAGKAGSWNRKDK